MYQSGVQLFGTANDTIISEVRNENFPFSQNNRYITDSDKASDLNNSTTCLENTLTK